MKNFYEFVNLVEQNKELLQQDFKNDYNRLLKEFKPDDMGELYRISLISYMAGVRNTINLLKNYHDWSKR